MIETAIIGVGCFVFGVISGAAGLAALALAHVTKIKPPGPPQKAKVDEPPTELV